MFERIARPLAGLSGWIARRRRRHLSRPRHARASCCRTCSMARWIGHALHPLLTDVVVGGATAAVLLRGPRLVRGRSLSTATTWILGFTCLSALAAIVSGLTDFKDTLRRRTERGRSARPDQPRRDRRPGRGLLRRARATAARCWPSRCWSRYAAPGNRRLHRRAPCLQVRLHGQLQRLRRREAGEGSSRGCRRGRAAGGHADQGHARHHCAGRGAPRRRGVCAEGHLLARWEARSPPDSSRAAASSARCTARSSA